MDYNINKRENSHRSRRVNDVNEQQTGLSPKSGAFGATFKFLGEGCLWEAKIVVSLFCFVLVAQTITKDPARKIAFATHI